MAAETKRAYPDLLLREAPEACAHHTQLLACQAKCMEDIYKLTGKRPVNVSSLAYQRWTKTSDVDCALPFASLTQRDEIVQQLRVRDYIIKDDNIVMRWGDCQLQIRAQREVDDIVAAAHWYITNEYKAEDHLKWIKHCDEFRGPKYQMTIQKCDWYNGVMTRAGVRHRLTRPRVTIDVVDGRYVPRGAPAKRGRGGVARGRGRGRGARGRGQATLSDMWAAAKTPSA